MPNRTFFWFILPSALAMLLLIALPIVSAVVQSFYISHPQVMVTTEDCGPFGCTKQLRVDEAATRALRDREPLGRFNGFGTYTDYNHLASSEVAKAWREARSMGAFFNRLMDLPFYRALAFTLTFTFVVTPLVILFGLAIALGVNALPGPLKGPVIFISLLPMIITPLIGSLVLFWMIDSNGIVGSTIQRLSGDPNLSLKASASLTWIMLIVYGVWHSAPFAFVVLYAGLQSVPQEALEAAMIDGASRSERLRYVVIPHLMPLTVFIGLIQLMDNFRVFEPIVGFNAEANAISLSHLIYTDLRASGIPLFGSASATSVLTIIGVMILMSPVLVRTWRNFEIKR